MVAAAPAEQTAVVSAAAAAAAEFAALWVAAAADAPLPASELHAVTAAVMLHLPDLAAPGGLVSAPGALCLSHPAATRCNLSDSIHVCTSCSGLMLAVLKLPWLLLNVSSKHRCNISQHRLHACMLTHDHKKGTYPQYSQASSGKTLRCKPDSYVFRRPFV